MGPGTLGGFFFRPKPYVNRPVYTQRRRDKPSGVMWSRAEVLSVESNYGYVHVAVLWQVVILEKRQVYGAYRNSPLL